MNDMLERICHDYYEASARDRATGLLDPGSFHEFLGPENRTISPHLAQFNLTGAFDDGLVIGAGSLNGAPVYIAAQEGRFMGGAFGEVHGAKFVGLLRAATANAAARRSLLSLVMTRVFSKMANVRSFFPVYEFVLIQL